MEIKTFNIFLLLLGSHDYIINLIGFPLREWEGEKKRGRKKREGKRERIIK